MKKHKEFSIWWTLTYWCQINRKGSTTAHPSKVRSEIYYVITYWSTYLEIPTESNKEFNLRIHILLTRFSIHGWKETEPLTYRRNWRSLLNVSDSDHHVSSRVKEVKGVVPGVGECRWKGERCEQLKKTKLNRKHKR